MVNGLKPINKNSIMNKKRIIKAIVLIEWLKFRLYPENYGISETIDHGIKMVKLGVELKKA